MNTIKLALARLRVSLTVVKSHKVLIWFAIINILLFVAVLGVAGWSVGNMPIPSDYFAQQSAIGAVFLAVFFILNLIGIFFAATFFSAASTALAGEKVRFSEAFGAAWARRKYLAQWWLFTSGIFIVIFIIQFGLEKVLSVFGKGASTLISTLTGGVLQTGWSLAAYFAVPVIMTHPDSPIPTIKRSASLFKRSFGEDVTAQGSLFLLGVFIFWLSGCLVGLINFTIFTINPAIDTLIFGIVAGSIFGTVLATLVIIGTTTRAVFYASLYRFAETGDYVGPFNQEIISGAFAKKKTKFF